MSEEREVVKLENERGELREYETVASRLARFRADKPDWTLRTEVFKDDGNSIAVKATIGFYATDGAFCVLAEGHAEEFRGSTKINRTACMENAETSAWGRALAALGYASPTSVATADEIEKAQRRQRELEEQEPGTLILLQNAAKEGTAALRKAWVELTETQRAACGNSLNKLKRQAAEVDRGKQQEAGPSAPEGAREGGESVRDDPPAGQEASGRGRRGQSQRRGETRD